MSKMIIWGYIGSTDDHSIVLRNALYFAQLTVITACTTLVLKFNTFVNLKSKIKCDGAVLGAVIIIMQQSHIKYLNIVNVPVNYLWIIVTTLLYVIWIVTSYSSIFMSKMIIWGYIGSTDDHSYNRFEECSLFCPSNS